QRYSRSSPSTRKAAEATGRCRCRSSSRRTGTARGDDGICTSMRIGRTMKRSRAMGRTPRPSRRRLHTSSHPLE
ncbi:hypothetical protein B0H10DRAFT_2126587, partial [Mycena sp. CBHHK59/15]